MSHIFSLVIEAFKFLKSRFEDAIEEIKIESVCSDFDESQNQFENSQIEATVTATPTVKEEDMGEYTDSLEEQVTEEYTDLLQYQEVVNDVDLDFFSNKKTSKKPKIHRISAKKRKLAQEEKQKFYHEETMIIPKDYYRTFGIDEIDDPGFFHENHKIVKSKKDEKYIILNDSKYKVEPQYTTPNSKGKIDCFKERDDFLKLMMKIIRDRIFLVENRTVVFVYKDNFGEL